MRKLLVAVLLMCACVEADTTSGTIEIAYSPTDEWSFSLGLSSTQPALTADGKRVRFPFLDLVSPANNYTGLYFGFGYTL